MDCRPAAARTVIYVPLYNRLALAREAVDSLRAGKGRAHLRLVDDASTEGDPGPVLAMGDSAAINPRNLGVSALRVLMLFEFCRSDFDYCYFTDSDTLHDPRFLDRLFDMHARAGTLCSLYNSSTPLHKDGTVIPLGDDIVLRRSVPGVSMFFDKPTARRIVEAYAAALADDPLAAERHEWDWFFCAAAGRAALSTVSYVEHFGAGGLHSDRGEDRALNPTPALAALASAFRRGRHETEDAGLRREADDGVAGRVLAPVEHPLRRHLEP